MYELRGPSNRLGAKTGRKEGEGRDEEQGKARTPKTLWGAAMMFCVLLVRGKTYECWLPHVWGGRGQQCDRGSYFMASAAARKGMRVQEDLASMRVWFLFSRQGQADGEQGMKRNRCRHRGARIQWALGKGLAFGRDEKQC